MIGIGEVVVGLVMLALVIVSLYVLSDYDFRYYNKPIHIGGKRCWINRKRGFKVHSFGNDEEFIISKEDAKFENYI